MANLLAFRALDHLKKYCSDTQNKLSIANNKTFYIKNIHLPCILFTKFNLQMYGIYWINIEHEINLLEQFVSA